MDEHDEQRWEELVSVGLEFLIERAELETLTTYTEMNAVLIRRAGWRGFDFGREDERAAMGRLLGEIVERNYPKSGCMISALVKYLNENDAGPGFYRLATQMGLLPPGASSKAKDQFWVGQTTCAYERYARKRRRQVAPQTPGSQGRTGCAGGSVDKKLGQHRRRHARCRREHGGGDFASLRLLSTASATRA